MKVSVTFIVAILLLGFLHFSVVSSLATDSVSITSTGKILILNVYANSGSASDIQDSIDQVVAAGGVGNVHIPEGVFNFIEDGEPWRC